MISDIVAQLTARIFELEKKELDAASWSKHTNRNIISLLLNSLKKYA